MERIASTTGHRLDDVFTDFCRLAACALSAGTREDEYMEKIKRWQKEQQEGFAQALASLVTEMEREPFTDLLGPAYMAMNSVKSLRRGGEFFTPQEISELCARMLMGEPDNSDDPVSFMEPACGAGGMILSAAKIYAPFSRRVSRLRVTAIDINSLCCDMTFINTTLWGIPCHVLHGNTLSGEYWHSYKNIHWIFCREDSRVFAEAPKYKPGQPPSRKEADRINAALREKEPLFHWREMANEK